MRPASAPEMAAVLASQSSAAPHAENVSIDPPDVTTPECCPFPTWDVVVGRLDGHLHVVRVALVEEAEVIRTNRPRSWSSAMVRAPT